MITTEITTGTEHVCFTDGPACERCGDNTALHIYNCSCDECENDYYDEACDDLEY